jgi:hypothetical protein
VITLEFGDAKIPEFNSGETVHLKVKNIYEMAPGKWRLEVEDVTPLPGAEPPGYACHLCGIIEQANDDGSLPDGWVRKTFPDRSFFVCAECETGPHERYCRVCGCKDDDPCEDGCYWVEEDLCSACDTPKK